MKFNKSLIIISLLLIFCISLGAVSAADSADMSVNDINNDDIATVESSVNVDDEISIVSEGEIHNSSEIYGDIKSATGTYNITTDYQIDTTWEIPNENVIIEGNNHTIYGNGNRAFKITGNNVTIQNLNFVICSGDISTGGAIYFGESSSGSVVNCSFVGFSANMADGGAILANSLIINKCSFVGCSAEEGGAIYSYCGIFNYNIFENNDATHGKAIFILSKDYDVNYNFFGFQNTVIEFPSGLVEGATLENWVVLNISSVDIYYFVNFVLNNGSALEKSMPDYDVNLTINGNSEVITVSDNTFKHINKAGDYLATSLASGELLATATIPISNVSDYSVVTFDCDYGDIAKVGVSVPNGVTGTVSVNVSGKVVTGVIKEGMAIILLTGLNAGNYVLDVSYSGNDDFYPFNITKNLTVNKVHVTITPTALSTTYDSGKYFQVKVVNSEGKVVSGLKLSLKVYTGSSYKTVTVTTDANGIAKYSASKLSITTHKVVVDIANSNYSVDKKK